MSGTPRKSCLPLQLFTEPFSARATAWTVVGWFWVSFAEAP